MKLKIEKVFSSGWDKENDLNQYVFFSDDGGKSALFEDSDIQDLICIFYFAHQIGSNMISDD